jgi:hypothetical protein
MIAFMEAARGKLQLSRFWARIGEFFRRDPAEGTHSRTKFTRDELRDEPSKVMRAARTAGRVTIVEEDGRLHLTIARQTEELPG